MLYDPSRNTTGFGPFWRDRVLVWACGGLCLALLGLLAARGILREPPGVSSFAALADAILHGRFWVEKCPEIDCAVFDGKTYVIFPPLPALLLAPLVAVTGLAAFKGAIAISILLALASLYLWSRIFRELGADRGTVNWLLAAVAFASPLYYVVLKSNGAWFLAQSAGFLLATLAIASIILWRNLVLACAFVALGFMCRQMLIFYPVFLVILALDRTESLLRPRLSTLRTAAIAALPVLAALALIFAYNYARFGHPLDTGYGHISNPASSDYITKRMADIGLFSPKYMLFNLYHLFLQGFHADFDALHQVRLTAIDWNGTALLIACPWLALAFYMRLDRVAAAGFAVISVIAGITLLYHSNGYAQIGASRYILDWLPVALVLLARSARPNAFAALPLLVTIAVAMNAASLATAILAAAP